MFINPPYMTNIIVWTYHEIMKAFDMITNDELLLIVLIPKREESEGYQLFKNNKYLIHLIEPDIKKHYMNCNGRLNYMDKVVNSMFFLSKHKHHIKQNEILQIWNTPCTDDQQSTFTGPTI